jgi:putative tricarboxylic transport membrane protein
MILGACLAGIALVLIFGSFQGKAAVIESFAIRPAAFVLGATLMFAVLIRPLGLPLTVFLLVFPAAFADGRRRLVPLFTLALVLSVGTTLLFPLALGQQIPILGTVFDY